jgi:chromosome segregation ATPase
LRVILFFTENIFMNFNDWLFAYIGFAIAWIVAGIIFYFWKRRKISAYRSLVENYRYELDVLNDNFQTANMQRFEAEQKAETFEIENNSLTKSLSKRQNILIERDNEIKTLISQHGEGDQKLEGLRQEVFRKTEQIDVLHRQVMQKSIQIEQFEKELEVQKTYVAQLHLKSGDGIGNSLLVEKNNQIASLHSQIADLLPLESKLSLQNEEIDFLRIEKQKLLDTLEERKNIINELESQCEDCKAEVAKLTDSEESSQLEALILENIRLREELEKQSERMN